jgi:hypothetical protein
MLKYRCILLTLVLAGFFVPQSGAAWPFSSSQPCKSLSLQAAWILAPQNIELRQDLQVRIEQISSEIPAAKKKAFLEAVSESRVRSHLDKYPGSVHAPSPWFDSLLDFVYRLRSIHGKIDGTSKSIGNARFAKSKKVSLSFAGGIVNHPLARVILVHELNHLKRVITRFGGVDWKQFATLYYTKDGLVKDEKAAAAAEYDEIHLMFDQSSWRTEVEKYDQLVKIKISALQAKIGDKFYFRFDTKTNGIFIKPTEMQREEHPALVSEAFRDAYIVLLDLQYKGTVTRAFKVSREEYIQSHISNYRDTQATLFGRFRNKISTLENAALDFGVEAAIAYYLYKLFI